MSQITWKEVAEIVGHQDKTCASAIASLVANAEGCGEACTVSYRYGESIFADGQLLWPGASPAPEDYFDKNGLCLGFIVRNTCEVQDRRTPSQGDTRVMRAPEALLGPGQWLGLFEYLDRFCDIGDIASPDWNICAGSTEVLAMASVGTAEVKKLRKKVHGVPEGDQPNPTLFEMVSPILQQKNIPWEAEVLFLPISFLNILSDRMKQEFTCPYADRLFARLCVTAWHGLAKTRHEAYHEIAQAFMSIGLSLHRELDSQGRSNFSDFHKKAGVMETAARLAAYLVRVSAGASVAYAPADKDDVYGPFGKISDIVKQWKIKPTTIMRPLYVKIGQNGFARLADVDPSYFSNSSNGKSYRDRVEEISRVLCRIISGASRTPLRPEQARHVQRVRELLLRTMIRVPPSEGFKGASVIRWRDDGRGGLKIEAGNDGSFFEGSFKKNGWPTKRSPFFMAALRLDR